ncbi:FAD-dependent oxidoreductase [Clostridium fallax]|uniref:Succinate dehydrogenase/fumarate reductase, flavoprotein subunit n=1 Tax=Clostridium fallax TaxID=1533 RepID=A0A1M4YL32_9CLOT|nr:FAD-binding protein [Clostridium fallax]SHF06460.1 Succinate dehydrogenase/fumarate reductase, flavoprotein subunit [Clostridium fallax]SQB06448.1 FAD flavoprotein oxidase [Clostridium fallax]
MKVNNIYKDIVIVGTGLAGISALKNYINTSLEVAVVTTGEKSFGASFYPGTWGLGMVYSDNEEDKKDFVKTISKVGGYVNNENLTKILVEEGKNSVLSLYDLGVKLKDSINNDLVVPCYDHKGRTWKGFDFASAKESFNKLFLEKNIELFNNSFVIDIFNFKDLSKGLLMINKDKSLTFIRCKALIIASGGYTCIYDNNFSQEKNTPIIHYFLEKLGCKMKNLEFIQFIPTSYCSKYRVVFNERAYEYVNFYKNNEKEVIPKEDKKYLKERSTYAPFTSRMKSKKIDLHIFKENVKNANKVYFKYPKNIENIEDTLIQNYFKWLVDKYGKIDEKINIIHCAHACNGGVEINERGETSVDGIFACGEVTGGIHGADRIGGLSTVGAIVFGNIAGKNAKEYINKININKDLDVKSIVLNSISELNKIDEKVAEESVKYFKKSLYYNTAIIRKIDNLIKLKKNYKKLLNSLYINYYNKENCYENLLIKSQAKSYLVFGESLLNAMINRKESLGSHYIEK